MDLTSGTNPTDPPAAGPGNGQAEQAAPGPAAAPGPPQQPQPPQPEAHATPAGRPGFRARGRARRRARFLRKARELAYRDLGGLVFNLHRFGQRNDPLVISKLNTLSHIDDELRSVERVLRERVPVTVLREAGITACPRCAAIHASEDRFCPNCGLPMDRHADLPVAGAPVAPAAAAAVPAAAAHVSPAPAPAHAAATPAPAQAPATGTHETQAPVPAPPHGQPGHAPAPTPTRSMPVVGAGNQPDRERSEESTEILHPQAPGA